MNYNITTKSASRLAMALIVLISVIAGGAMSVAADEGDIEIVYEDDETYGYGGGDIHTTDTFVVDSGEVEVMVEFDEVDFAEIEVRLVNNETDESMDLGTVEDQMADDYSFYAMEEVDESSDYYLEMQEVNGEGMWGISMIEVLNYYAEDADPMAESAEFDIDVTETDDGFSAELNLIAGNYNDVSHIMWELSEPDGSHSSYDVDDPEWDNVDGHYVSAYDFEVDDEGEYTVDALVSFEDGSTTDPAASTYTHTVENETDDGDDADNGGDDEAGGSQPSSSTPIAIVGILILLAALLLRGDDR